ncbi:MAG: hypothetical protein V4557_10715 [Bacteroidota bacterium]
MFRNLVENIKGSIEIRQQEKKLFRLLFLHSFLIGLSSSLFFVEASRSFIVKISIADMPSAYIVSGLTGYLLIRLFKSLQKKFGVIRSFELILFIFSASMLLLYFGRVEFGNNIFYAKALAYTGFVLMFAFATLFAVGFAGICLMIFNLSQSKRLLALLGTGEIMASIIGYLVIPILVKIMGDSIYLLLLSAFFSLISIWPIRKVGIEKGPAVAVIPKALVKAPKFNLAFIGKNPFILYLSLTTLFSIISVYFIDYSYLISVRYFSQTTGVEIATIVAMLFSIIKTGELFFSFFSSSIVASTGMKTAVLALPYLLIFGCIMAVFSVLFFNASPVFMIFFLFINKWTDRVIRKGVTAPSMKIMFQINSPDERVQLQNNIDGVISQLSTIVCGAMLMGVCFFVSTADPYQFLTATTLVCLVVFIIFLFMTSCLFHIYKNRIQEYLRSKHVITPPTKKETASVNYVPGNETAAGKIEILLNEVDLSDRNKIREMICYYNPSAEAYIHFNNEGTESEFIRKITKLYFDNQNIFSRVLIISYFLCLDFSTQLIFFKDTYRISSLRLRSYFLKGLCSAPDTIATSEIFSFMELISQCVNEILWTEAAINDLEAPGERQIVIQLKAHKTELTNLLLYLLQLLHDKKSVQLVADMLNKKERSEEDILFAVELLENILRSELKKMILPVFEPISFISRRNKLNKIFFAVELSGEERLQDILMHDFNVVDSYTKQLALEALREMDPSKTTVKAFSESRISNLKAIADSSDSEKTAKDNFLQKNEIVTQLCRLLSLDRLDCSNVTRWGIHEANPVFLKNKTDHHFANNTIKIPIDISLNKYVEVDLLAIALLYKIKIA